MSVEVSCCRQCGVLPGETKTRPCPMCNPYRRGVPVTAPAAPDRLAEAEALHAEVIGAALGFLSARTAPGTVAASLIGGLRKVAERHAPQQAARGGLRCWVCVDPDDPDERPAPSPWPCQTFRDVAAAVGVEVEG